MTDERKQNKRAHGDSPLHSDPGKSPEQLDREPILRVERREGRTYVVGEIDLDQLATEADEALAGGFTRLRDFAEYDAQEALLLVVEALHDRMRELGISEAELARRMAVSRSYISRLINATPNLTVISLAKWARALGGRIRISLEIDSDQEHPGRD